MMDCRINTETSQCLCDVSKYVSTMDIKILLLICYNAVSISESYYAPPESIEHSVVSQLQNGNRRLDSDIGNENPDQCCGFPIESASLSLEEQLDPHNNGIQRLVVYLYLNVPSDQAYLYIPNHDKQSLFPSLYYEQNDVLQNLTDKGILRNNTDMSILINNTSPQSVIADTGNVTDMKWTTDNNASINKSPSRSLREPPTKPKNLQSPDLLNTNNSKQKPGLIAPTDKTNLFQTPNPNSRSHSIKSSWENRRFNDYAERPSKSPLDYNDSEYGNPPFFQRSIKREKELRPPAIGFNQVPYSIISQVPEPKLNLSEIIPNKMNIVHFIPNNHEENSILQPYGLILPDNIGNEVSVNMIRVPVNLNMVRVPQTMNTISLDKSSIPLNLIGAPTNYFKDGANPANLKSEPDIQYQVHPNLPKFGGSSDNLGVYPYMNHVPSNSPKEELPDNLGLDPNMIQVAPNLLDLGGRSDNLEVDPYMTQSPLNHPSLVQSLDNFVVDPNMIQVPPNLPKLEGRSDNLGADPNMIQIPPNHPTLEGRPGDLGVGPNMIQIPPNRPNLKGSPGYLGVNPNMIEIPSNRQNLGGKPNNLGVDPNMIHVPLNLPNLGKNPDNLRANLEINKARPNVPNSAGSPDDLEVESYMIRTPPNQHQLLRMNTLFTDWFYKQIANQGLDIQIDIDTLKRDIVKTLARYNMYITEDGYLIDAQGNIISWDYLQLRTILVGEPMDYETIINSPDPIHFEPSNTYWKALLTTFGPSSETVILDIIPLGKMQLEKSDVKPNVPIDNHICKSGDCKVIVPVQVGDQAMLANLQNYIELEAQHSNIEQLLNRRNLGLKLDGRKAPSKIYDKYRASKGQQRSKLSKETLTKSGRREKDPVLRGMATVAPRTRNYNKLSEVIDWRIIGGAAATSSGAPISVKGRSGYIF